MMNDRSYLLFLNLFCDTIIRGHGSDKEEECGFTSGHRFYLDAEYMTAT
jgi:hypothetical protein